MREKGKTHIHKPGHGVFGGGVGAVGGLLRLIGGPAGLLAWAVGGAAVGDELSSENARFVAGEASLSASDDAKD